MTEPLTAVLVDDSPEVRALVRTQLRLSGAFDVVGEGASGTDALALAARHRPAVMLLDVSMPGMDGLTALPGVLVASPGTRVVLFSGFDAGGVAARGRALGATGFIEKSVPADQLAEDLLALLAADSPPGAPVAGRDSEQDDGSQDDGRQDDGSQDDGEADRGAEDGGVGHRDVLAEDLERFREVFEEAAIGMATMTLAGRVVRGNRALAEVLRRPLDQIVGADYVDLVRGGEAVVRQHVADLGSGRADSAQAEHGVVGPGRRRVSATVAVVRGHSGRPLYLFLQARDVTQQRAADEALRQSEERFRLLVEAVQDYAIFMLHPDGTVASWNAGAQRIKGYTAEEVLGTHFRRFYPRDRQLERHPEHELVLALRDGRYQEEGWRVRKDGSTFFAHVTITAVRTEAGEHVGFAKVTRDVTEWRHATEQRAHAAAALASAKEELEAMNARLLQAAQEQAQFVAVTAHELRTPVSVVGGSARTLAQHWARLEDEERQSLLDGMVSSAARMARLLDDLLTAARLEAGVVDLDLQPVAMTGVLDAAVAAARRDRPHDDVVVRVQPGLVAVADPDRLAQAVDNLLTNALRHGAPPVQVHAAAEGDAVVIRVRDAGPGVPAPIRPRLFERFATGERRTGTGLGLFIVRELARAQGGDAWYEADDAGGTFALSLPPAPRP